MEEEDEDERLLSSLGVTSTNIEDIEKKVLSEAKSNLCASVSGASSEEQGHDEDHEADALSTAQIKLYNKLHAVELEIDAVASSIEGAKPVTEKEIKGTSNIDRKDGKRKKSNDDSTPGTPDGVALQQALAVDRLRSLERTRAQLEREISEFNGIAPAYDIRQEELLSELVEEKPKHRKSRTKVGKINRNLKRKTVLYNDDADFDAVLDSASAGFMETEREELVRKGKLTPFHMLKGFERRVQQPGPSNQQNASEEDPTEALESAIIAKVAQSMSQIAQARPTTKLLDAKALPGMDVPTRPFQRLGTPLKRPISPSMNDMEKKKRKSTRKRPLPDKIWRKESRKRKLLDGSDEETEEGTIASDHAEESQRDDESSSVILEGGLKIPEIIYSQLFDYQKVGVQWLWELHCQRAGGIIGDEMGLGKTVQVIAFLGALHFSKMYQPSIVICPVTLLRQWQREAHRWYPNFKVEILHDSANGPNRKMVKKSGEKSDYDSESSWDSDVERPYPAKSTKKWDDLIGRVTRSEVGLLLTTYEQLRLLGEKLLDIEWGYAILDEGHRIRNPNAEITLVCKQLQTVHRIIMTGAPIQNKLSELWSLFDFVFPGKLGVLPVFETEFAVPITVGGYANATPLQVSTAYRCAVILRDLIMPYLLRRMKADVNAQLPKKTEHVLFCSLTSEQRAVYRAFLASSEVEQIFDGSRNSLYGIDALRKICNHPDLLEREHCAQHPDYGNPERSGKMKVVAQVVKVWKEQGHRVLLFTQTQQMLDIIENFLISRGYTYRRMDGLTPVKHRMALIDEFNNSEEVFVFILTTKVGGLGTNLTGADRVIIYDPDWNPSTDMQARERAWRIGQTREVTVYRLITRGTIEEKVYHRQIYKHFLTNKVLKNPQQRRFFKARDMKDLFTLQDDNDGVSTETSNIFCQLSEDVNVGVANDQQHTQGSSSTVPSCRIAKAKEASSDQLGGSSSGSKGKEQIDQENGVDDEIHILKSLFDAHGIHSAMNHDAIMNANDDQKMRLEEEASHVAQRAAEALRHSRILRSHDSFAVPTWTGKAGAAGAPSSIRRKFGSTLNTQILGASRSSDSSSSRPNGISAGTSNGKALSSAELLARIRGTQEQAVIDALEQDLDLASSSNLRASVSERNGVPIPTNRGVFVQPEVLIRQICTFMQQRGGRSDSTSITQHFRERIQPKDLILFKSLLKEIATLEKNSHGSAWVLKPEYQQ